MAVEHEGLRQSLIDSCQNTANHDTEEEDEVKTNGSKSDDVSLTGKEKESPEHEMDEEEDNEGDAKFNEDLLCEHGRFAAFVFTTQVIE